MEELSINNQVESKLNRVTEVHVSQILANRYQPRTIFEEIELQELANSIKQHGILQPIILRQVTSDMYEIVAGERRFRASKLAGLDTVSAIIKEISSSDAAILALIENVQREDLSSIEEARSYEQLMELFSKTQNEIAEMVGKSQSSVANKLRLLQLSEEVKQAIERKLIGERHGRALLKLKEHAQQNKVLEITLQKALTVADLESYIDKLLRDAEVGASTTVFFNIAKDTKLAVNTVNKAIKTIREFGMELSVEQTESEIDYTIQIVIPKNMVEVAPKAASAVLDTSDYNSDSLKTLLADKIKAEPKAAVEPQIMQQNIAPLAKTEDSKTKPLVLDFDLTSEIEYKLPETSSFPSLKTEDFE
ncbi:MAG: ParB/RepB/Spo0J family partition protein [Culicoidibacterales bacterium]